MTQPRKSVPGLHPADTNHLIITAPRPLCAITQLVQDASEGIQNYWELGVAVKVFVLSVYSAACLLE